MVTRKKHALVDEYIKTCPKAVIPLLGELRALIHAEMPGASEAMKYGAPVFLNANNVPVIYLFGSNRHVNFGFLRSRDLSDPLGLLKGSGKPSKHIKLYPGTSYDIAILKAFIKQCAPLQD